MHILLIGWLAIIVFMSLIWMVSVAKKDASIVDMFWAPGFALNAWLYFALTGPSSMRKLVICSAVSFWAIRLGGHIHARSKNKGEDYRYREMREQRGTSFWWKSFFIVFMVQGALMWLIGMPLYMAQLPSGPAVMSTMDWFALAVFVVGLCIEGIADWQLTRFTKNPANAGKVMDQGLWRYSRHPNYFGDALLWWGLYLFTLSVPGGWTVIHSPIIMTALLLKVSGVTLLEKKLTATRPGYEQYARKTNAFLPWFPRTNLGNAS